LPHLKKELGPSQDIGTLMLRVQGKPSDSLEKTSETMQKMEDLIKSKPYVAKTFTNIGGYGGGEVSSGNMFITLVDRDKRQKQQVISAQLREELKQFKGLKIQVIDLSQGAFSPNRGTTLEISLRGPDYGVLNAKATEIIERMNKSGEFTDADTDYREGAKQLNVYPNRDKAAQSNVTVQTIAQTVNAAIGGIRTGQFTNDDRRYDVRLRLQQGQWTKPEDLNNVMVRTGYGEMVPLTEVADTKLTSTLMTVTRINRMHSITLFANNAPGVSQDKALDDLMRICHEVLPENYKAVPVGYTQNNKETFQGIWYIFFLGFLVAYMVLAAQFNSFVHPLAVLIVIPFTLTGAILSLYLTGNSLNVYSAIGLILLMGIAKKNSILLVEFFNRQRFDHDRPIHEAILTGGPIRLRPILMTSAATIAAAVPAAFGLGPGAEVRIPLAIVVIGGVIVSTLFSLLVVPCLYSCLTRFEGKYSPNKWKKMLES
jgi:HAE1 family hydrophobic/amphiphilic exporter-1